jgi:CheY-like chemotaxis protein
VSIPIPPKKILIVDDSRFLRLANERALVKSGHTVKTASDGEEALRLATSWMPDLVVLDMMLPKMSGQEVLHALKADPATQHIPVMVLTSLPQCNEEKLKAEGATAYHQKELLHLDKNAARFVEAVEQLLARAYRIAAVH